MGIKKNNPGCDCCMIDCECTGSTTTVNTMTFAIATGLHPISMTLSIKSDMTSPSSGEVMPEDCLEDVYGTLYAGVKTDWTNATVNYPDYKSASCKWMVAGVPTGTQGHSAQVVENREIEISKTMTYTTHRVCEEVGETVSDYIEQTSSCWFHNFESVAAQRRIDAVIVEISEASASQWYLSCLIYFRDIVSLHYSYSFLTRYETDIDAIEEDCCPAETTALCLENRELYSPTAVLADLGCTFWGADGFGPYIWTDPTTHACDYDPIDLIDTTPASATITGEPNVRDCYTIYADNFDLDATLYTPTYPMTVQAYVFRRFQKRRIMVDKLCDLRKTFTFAYSDYVDGDTADEEEFGIYDNDYMDPFPVSMTEWMPRCGECNILEEVLENPITITSQTYTGPTRPYTEYVAIEGLDETWTVQLSLVP